MNVKLSTGEGLAPPCEPLRILLVEDNPINQKVARLMLSRMGHRVVTADDGAKAVELVQQTDLDIILMDIQMPVMDGFEATRQIRSLEGHDRIPIIAMTAHAMAGDRERCMESGMDDYISKPIHSASLQEIIERHRLAPANP